MSSARATPAWVRPAAIGVLLAVVFAAALDLSPVVRHYWPLLVISAVAAALPFLLNDVTTARSHNRPLALHTPVAIDGRESAVPALRATAISLPKTSAAEGENEDAYGIDVDSGHLAVADGASSSVRAGEWAHLLCTTFLRERPLAAMPSLSWITKATATLRESADQGTAWWSSEAAQRGAHAAFIGLSVLREEQRLSWRATAVGDCVLVHLRAASAGAAPIVTAFPISHSASFPPNPTLLSSTADGHPPVSYIDGSAEIGDVWLLMTDELARWALRRHEAGDPGWDLLVRGSESELVSAMATARASDGMADDDLTVVRCEVVPAD